MAQEQSSRHAARIAFWLGLGLLIVSLIFAAAVRISQTIPDDFTLPALGGGSIHLAGHRGRWVILNFWASWCVPCVEEMPDLQAFYQAHTHQAVDVIGVNVGEPESTARDFVSKVGVTFPVALDADASVATRYGMRGLPMTLVIDRYGLIRWSHMGRVTVEMLEQQIK